MSRLPPLNTETLRQAKDILRRAGYDVVRNSSTEVKSFDPVSFQEYLDKNTDCKV